MKQMDRRRFLKIIGTGAAVFYSGASLFSKNSDREKPNIILIMADDLGYECLGSDGGTSYKTPRLDSMAESGMRFDHCYAMPLCTPTRVQLMTGKYNFRNYTEFGSLKPGETTFAHLFKNAGYRTCVVGKWQLAGHYPGSHQKGKGTLPHDAGFDEHCLWQVHQRGSRYWDPIIQQNGKILTGMKDKYGPDIFLQYIQKFLKKNTKSPFFLYYPMALTHSPFLPTPDTPDWQQKKRQNNPRYFSDMVEYMDKIVGQILDTVDKVGLAKNTLILFTGDNGTHQTIKSAMGNRIVRGRKGETVDGGTHVPLIASWPGVIPSGKLCSDLIDFTDFLPTLLDAADINAPADMLLDGKSFFPQLRNEKGNPREWIFCHYEPKWGRWKPARYIQSKRWKIYSDGRIFDAESDLEESQPLSLDALDKSSIKQIRKLQDVLRSMK